MSAGHLVAICVIVSFLVLCVISWAHGANNPSAWYDYVHATMTPSGGR